MLSIYVGKSKKMKIIFTEKICCGIFDVFVPRKRSQNLLIVEGNHEKNELFALLFKCFPEMNIDIDEEEQFNDGKKLSKDALSLSRFIVKRLCETGWIEIEYGVDTSFKEYIALAPYSIKIINIPLHHTTHCVYI